jgi:metal-responsive CopG/Arc/MetJ family transcriptional regulator
MKPKPPPIRSDDNDRISFSLPKALLEKIDAAAAANFQNRSQFLVMHMTRITARIEAQAKESERTTALPKAETQPEAPHILPMVAEVKTLSHSTHAATARPVKYPAGRTRKKA